MLQTRRQTEEALRSSHMFTEKFWKAWSQQYLTALREHHIRKLPGSHGTPKQPQPDDVVLIADTNLPRNSWKIGRITSVTTNMDGAVREAHLIMPNRRTTKRPINQLIPLELNDPPQERDTQETTTHQPSAPIDDKTADAQATSSTQAEAQNRAQRYSLRNRPRVDYDMLHRGGLLPILCLMSILTLSNGTFANPTKPPVTMGMDSTRGTIQCTDGGVLITTANVTSYELCAEGYCIVRDNPPAMETLQIPPEITLHKHTIHWKVSNGKKLKTIEKTCPASPFCSRVDCWFCTANVFNPECQPRTAIITMAVIIYIAVAFLYTICYIPVVIGRPCRIFFHGCRLVIAFVWGTVQALAQLLRRNGANRYRRRQSRTGFIPLVLIFGLLCLGRCCQDVDILEHRTLVCSMSTAHRSLCKIDVTELIKLNTFNKEACFRIYHQGHLVKEIRLQWIKLTLTCKKETTMFTRHTQQRVLDSKRCSDAGSCKDLKCAGINTTTLVTELKPANEYPGLTFCSESCGGPGCGCWHWDSGCLFYRIYSKPLSKDIFEIFRCSRWNEEILVEVSVTKYGSRTKLTTASLTPSIPHMIDSMKFTITSLTIPPTPALQSHFITEGKHVALWKNAYSPTLQCASKQEAENLQCEVHPTCSCQPAEMMVNCVCTNYNLIDDFNGQLENRLPVRRPWITFEEDHTAEGVSVRATIPNLSTAEILVTVNDEFDKSVKEVTDSICKVDTTEITGCYNCPQGATAEITCISQEDETVAEIHCEDYTFSVPCTAKGTVSSLLFNFQRAQVYRSCTSACGTTKTGFKISGILHSCTFHKKRGCRESLLQALPCGHQPHGTVLQRKQPSTKGN
ncbi:hypothetical protein TELCIR_15448 [Teladorsagia circumcincta]|uniref:Phlebovirus glycoprotein G2 fusion domain-containing protein n=1 Tax=Teladorsagia circumcincta TaxID=45464 RepID=A0A2G9TZU4_TELCI|nr:hypothetical protein TELCIR_15448 [Teladorsagia circumcincta]